MNEDLQLGYLVLGVTDVPALDSILENVVGLRGRDDGDNRVYRMDDWDRRFIVRHSDTDHIGGIGLVARNDAVYNERLERLHDAKVDVRDGAPEEAATRSVREFVAFEDPEGIAVELAVAPSRQRGAGFDQDLVPGGFLTGAQGFGHAVVIADDRDAAAAFYTDVLGFEVSDTVEEETSVGTIMATFMHCNRRHHTIAIGQRQPSMPADKILGHFMVQANEFDSVGMAYDRALDAGLPIVRTLGRHPNDGMFSFYMRTPVGFDIEFGAGAIEIHDDWQVQQLHQGSAWGHRPGQGMK